MLGWGRIFFWSHFSISMMTPKKILGCSQIWGKKKAIFARRSSWSLTSSKFFGLVIEDHHKGKHQGSIHMLPCPQNIYKRGEWWNSTIFKDKSSLQMEYFNLLLNDSAPILWNSWESNCTFCCFADSHCDLFSCVFLILEFESMLIKALWQKFHMLLPVSIGL